MRGMLGGRIAVVTGAASGIGRATALAYASEEVKVVVSDIDEKGLTETADRVRAQGSDVLVLGTDIHSVGSTLPSSLRSCTVKTDFSKLEGSESYIFVPK